MPAALSYPGVYIEEVPSGVRTITGVPTSITAFVGRAQRGPVNEPVICNGYGDFERSFGSLWEDSSMSYAVRDFFLNGGGQAVIVRLDNGGETAELNLTNSGNTTLLAANPGAWGGKLSVVVDHNTKKTGDPAVDALLFNLTITDTGTRAVEKFINLSIDPASPRYFPTVLEQGSALVRVGTLPNPAVRPEEGTKTPAPADQGTDGATLTITQFTTGPNLRTNKEGLYALEKVDVFNLLCISPHALDGDIEPGLATDAAAYCEERRAVFIADPPVAWDSVADAVSGFNSSSLRSKNAALYFPRLVQANPLRENQLEIFAPCGAVAGVIARTDTQRGVWKAPAGLDSLLTGVPKLSVPLTDQENGQLNPLGVNCLRSLPAAGRVVWGARTTRGNDLLADEWKYLPVRRLALYIEESLFRGIQWVVFEPNDEPLWSQIRLNVGAFMQNLFRQGAFQGQSPRDAYFVKCDKETTTQNDINLGVVNIVVGFAPLKPAEFVVLKLQQMAGQVAA
ncbi:MULTISPECIES: phage tail sheath C-terminal domain-containing protein [unclassified Myxococcus]|uniref:phage tail sheath family protein n=1 Tax=unclassified Myxococcus TaxID=2648731 RepID=UPI00157AF1B0|nr:MULTISPECIES: phage tail sheath C-terminal domain-containing protein [unclassified Myxococcus]NTX07781.1 phage tail sheath family protein [Myxococcus sp. CA040A]NTX40996.1 phage tail sheath family protein [Myxococcus sp. CA033]NTX52452.1 phage tail sheath family protein [Myxococcus sp. CA039A]